MAISKVEVSRLHIRFAPDSVGVPASADERLRQGVHDALQADCAVPASRIGIGVEGAVVTLTGTVETETAALAAERDVHRVSGVLDVVNHVRVVSPATPHPPTDAEIAHAVRRALEEEADLPATRITTTIHDGWLTLEGTVSDPCQRYRAERAAGAVPGVERIANHIRIGGSAPGDDAALRRAVRAALRCVLGDRAPQVTVAAQHGTVTLRGSVSSWHERDAILSAAYAISGVARVDDTLRVLTLVA
ncbi:MAG TPA: BON domain-containing protein [Chloroflexota bacterium]|nr:BON domain-containing protein [Chloroflexota bacterium]